jgi:hypothetical protein
MFKRFNVKMLEPGGTINFDWTLLLKYSASRYRGIELQRRTERLGPGAESAESFDPKPGKTARFSVLFGV